MLCHIGLCCNSLRLQNAQKSEVCLIGALSAEPEIMWIIPESVQRNKQWSNVADEQIELQQRSSGE